ncbi:GspE/PulE family protein [Haloimpatiens massiliensis]|uniref:GspE/PulE family protein n=1 Tax=Haloimpatiens massiliensis TaxID=1658110 RepID=UPI000C860BA7|nr:ATPase, T2SS/T4P/T4SS family [Haloimpatiens massiliensis]
MKKKLGDLLLQQSKINPEQLKLALEKQKGTGKRLGEILIEEHVVTEEDIINTLEEQLGITRVYIDSISIDEECVKMVPESIALKYNLLPIGIDNEKIKVAMSDPLNIFAIDDVRLSSTREVEPYIAGDEEIKKAINKYYSSQYIKKAAEDLSKQQNVFQKTQEDIIKIDDIKNAPAVRLVDSVINNAVKMKASDIHIEPFEEYVRVRYRVDGVLHEVFKYNRDIFNAFITRIKILADLNIAEKRVPQDGRILTTVEDKPIDLRVSTLPTVYGEKAVLRILDRSNFLIHKEQLGMRLEDIEKVGKMIKSPYGIILVTGPTGSGKSTTLYTLLNEINSSGKNIITVEDPVEYMLEGVNQVNVNPKVGLTFASSLRSILRQDPDIVMIGEIRDKETAEISIRASITGHLMLSTIHTNDAPSSVIRLIDMGIEPYMVASSLSGVISQRLVRKICPHCKQKYKANTLEKNIIGVKEQENLQLFRGTGCTYCNGSGYMGRVGVYEIMEITKEHREYMVKSIDVEGLREISIEKGMKTLKSSCKELVLQGVTTVDELLNISFLKD